MKIRFLARDDLRPDESIVRSTSDNDAISISVDYGFSVERLRDSRKCDDHGVIVTSAAPFVFDADYTRSGQKGYVLLLLAFILAGEADASHRQVVFIDFTAQKP